MYIRSTMLKSTHDITYFNSHFKYILFAHELTFVVSYGVKILLYYANSKSAKNVNTFLRSTARASTPYELGQHSRHLPQIAYFQTSTLAIGAQSGFKL